MTKNAQEKYRQSEKGNASRKAYYLKNKERIKANSAAWQKENSQKLNEKKQRTVLS